MKAYLYWSSICDALERETNIELKMFGTKDPIVCVGVMPCVLQACNMRAWCDGKLIKFRHKDVFVYKCFKYFLSDKAQALLIDKDKSVFPNNVFPLYKKYINILGLVLSIKS